MRYIIYLQIFTQLPECMVKQWAKNFPGLFCCDDIMQITRIRVSQKKLTYICVFPATYQRKIKKDSRNQLFNGIIKHPKLLINRK